MEKPMNKIFIRRNLFSTAFALLVTMTGGEALAASAAMNDCLLERIKDAAPNTTVGELTAACEQQAKVAGADADAVVVAQETPEPKRESVVAIRINAEHEARNQSFVISTYRPNYIMYTHNSDPNEEPFDFIGELTPGESLDESEVKFQVSFKMPVATGLFGTKTDLLAAYTSTSWWQVFNDDVSSPFRETNYEPEIFFRHYSGAELWGMKFLNWDAGFNHQSNGRAEPLSRSWNRILGSTNVELTDDLVLNVRAWYRIPEDSEDDDNPHMRKYYGAGDVRLGWAPNRNTFTAMFRPGTEKNALELTWSYPISKYLRVYTQYFNGYGESLLDYNVHTERFGLGVALSDYLARP
jgi:phospholipase A1